MIATVFVYGWVAGIMTAVVLTAISKAVQPRESKHLLRRGLRASFRGLWRGVKWLAANAHRSMQNDLRGSYEEAEAL